MTEAAARRALVLIIVLLASATGGLAQSADPERDLAEAEVATAAVEVDGRVLFRVRGVSAFPAEKRAEVIADRIRTAAKDAAITPESIVAVDQDGFLAITAGDLRLMAVTSADSRVEGVTPNELAQVLLPRIRQAVEDFRYERSPELLAQSGKTALSATAVLAVALLVVIWAGRWIVALIEARFHARVRTVGISSFEVVRGERLWSGTLWLLGAARLAVLLTLLYFYLRFVLAAFPWTRWMAVRLRDWVLGPLEVMGRSLLGVIPDLIFLAILIVVVRYVVRLVQLFFEAVGEGRVELEGFDREWAIPTYKIVRLAVIAFALVVAYPYIPGSDSAAFKGVSLFIGVVFSIGSSTAVATPIAGYALTYRRAVRVGDVTAVRLQVTHLRTPKNEEVVIPNSEILGKEVVNYTSLAATHGLLLHTTVGIGYETPWRQVEAMLLLAAERTEGLLAEPKPFVQHKSLGDFCVVYELNVACSTPQRMAHLYTALHRSILDVFNEYGVQIMTPAYEGDPEVPKVVPREQWFSSPATTPRSELVSD